MSTSACPDGTQKQTCSEDTLNMGARKACELIETDTDRILGIIAEKAVTGTTLAGQFGSVAEARQSMQNILGANFDVTTYTQTENMCQNLTDTIQENTISGQSAECKKTILDAYTKMALDLNFSEERALEGFMELNTQRLEISDITQENKNVSIQSCVIDSVLDALTNMDASIDNSALQNALNQSTGIMAQSRSSANTCNELDVNMSACKYIQQKSCCRNKISTKQLNEIDPECSLWDINGVTQTNDNRSAQLCNLSASASISDQMAAVLVNKSSQESVNKSEGITASWLIAIAIVILAILLSPIILIKYAGEKIISMMGLILFLIGGILFATYWIGQKPEISRNDQPFAMCDATETRGDPITTSYGQARKKLTNVNIIGFDFFPEDKTIDPSTCTDDQSGVATYLGYVDRNDDWGCEEITDDDRSFTYVKPFKESKWLILGGIVMGAGILQTVIGGIIYYIATRRAKVTPSPSTPPS